MTDATYWDGRYGEQDQLFSGNPNGALVAEVSELPAGQALDVGCGEGADALWLAARGWQVTAVDVSRVALERAAQESGDEAANVSWTRADLTSFAPPAGAFDLVSAHYFPLQRQTDHAALRTLLAAVAPGGTLLVVSHNLADFQREHEHDHDIDPTDYYQPAEIAELLDDTWTIESNETRPRTNAPEGGEHVDDVVLRARRVR